MIVRVSFIFCIFMFGLVFGQSKEQLQKQNAALKKQIATINTNLAKTQK